MTAEVFGGEREPHHGFSSTTLLVAALAGVLVAALVLYPWQRQTIRDRDQTIAAMAAAHQSMQDQQSALRTQVTELRDQNAALQHRFAAERGRSHRVERRLSDTQKRLSQERQAHREAQAQARTMGGGVLEDGRYMIYARGVQLGTTPYLSFDLLSVSRGKAAERKAGDEGLTTDADGLFVTNESHALRTMPMDPNAPIEITYWHRKTVKTGMPVSLESFAAVINGTEWWQTQDQDSRYWMTVDGGRITSIHPYFTIIAC